MSIVPRLVPVLAVLPVQLGHLVHGLPAEPVIVNSTAAILGGNALAKYVNVSTLLRYEMLNDGLIHPVAMANPITFPVPRRP